MKVRVVTEDLSFFKLWNECITDGIPEWSTWASCSCFGSETKTREIICVSQAFKGQGCEEQVEEVPCEEGDCDGKYLG